MFNDFRDLVYRTYHAGWLDCRKERDYDPMNSVDAEDVLAEYKKLEHALSVIHDISLGIDNEKDPVDRLAEITRVSELALGGKI